MPGTEWVPVAGSAWDAAGVRQVASSGCRVAGRRRTRRVFVNWANLRRTAWHSLRPRTQCSMHRSASETCRGNQQQLSGARAQYRGAMRPMCASHVRASRLKESVPFDRETTGSDAKNTANSKIMRLEHTRMVLGRRRRMATFQTIDLSRQACSPLRALQESPRKRPRPIKTDATRGPALLLRTPAGVRSKRKSKCVTVLNTGMTHSTSMGSAQRYRHRYRASRQISRYPKSWVSRWVS